MKLETYKGVVAASPTMLTTCGEIDKKSTKKLMEHFVHSNLNGVFLLSSTGEYFTITPERREEFVEIAVEQIDGRIAVMAMVSDACIDIVKKNILIMANKKVDALVLTPPYYYKYSQNELFSFFTEAAETSPIPLILYNQPTRLPNEIGEDLIVRLSSHPNIIGIKDTSSDAVRMMKLVRICQNRKDFLYFNGSESVAAYAALLGANYLYALASIFPKLFLDIKDKGDKKDIKGIMQLQEKVDILCKLFGAVRGGSKESFSNFAFSIKVALEIMGIGQANISQFNEKLDEDIYSRVDEILEMAREK